MLSNDPNSSVKPFESTQPIIPLNTPHFELANRELKTHNLAVQTLIQCKQETQSLPPPLTNEQIEASKISQHQTSLSTSLEEEEELMRLEEELRQLESDNSIDKMKVAKLEIQYLDSENSIDGMTIEELELEQLDTQNSIDGLTIEELELEQLDKQNSIDYLQVQNIHLKQLQATNTVSKLDEETELILEAEDVTQPKRDEAELGQLEAVNNPAKFLENFSISTQSLQIDTAFFATAIGNLGRLSTYTSISEKRRQAQLILATAIAATEFIQTVAPQMATSQQKLAENPKSSAAVQNDGKTEETQASRPALPSKYEIQQTRQGLVAAKKDMEQDSDHDVLITFHEDGRVSLLTSQDKLAKIKEQYKTGVLEYKGKEYRVASFETLTTEEEAALKAQNEQFLKDIDEHLAILDHMLATIHAVSEEQEDAKTSERIIEDAALHTTSSRSTIPPSEALILLRRIVAEGGSVAPIMEAARKWNKKMIEMFIKQLEKEYKIKKEDVVYAMKQQEIRKEAADIIQKNQTQLRRPEKLSMLQILVKDLYKLHKRAKV